MYEEFGAASTAKHIGNDKAKSSSRRLTQLLTQQNRFNKNLAAAMGGVSLIALVASMVAFDATPALAACSSLSDNNVTGHCSGPIYPTSGSFTNSGSIGGGSTGVLISDTITISNFTNTNTGTISADIGSAMGIQIFSYTWTDSAPVKIGNLTNDGLIRVQTSSSSAAMTGIINYHSSIGALTNNGTIIVTSPYATNHAAGIYNSGVIDHLTNTGLISATIGTMATGILNCCGFNNEPGKIGTLMNLGTINADHGIRNADAGSIGTLINLGAITSQIGSGISNFNGTIDTLINGQGGNLAFGGSINAGTFGPDETALTFTGQLPTLYQEHISDLNHFGQVEFSSVTGIMDFSVASGSTTGANQIYEAVLTGLTSNQIGGSISGTMLSSCGTITANCFQGRSNGYIWELYQEGTTGALATTWDLFITGIVSAPELDGSLFPRALLLLFIAYLLGGGVWPLHPRQANGDEKRI